jgi:glycerophosphoryl diester phosphodiesterase
VVAHRARGFGGPDNSREAVGNAIAAGQLMIEVDLRRTQDGQVVVFHNRRLDAVTSGQGEVAGRTIDELQGAHLSNGETIPRFTEIYALTRGRAVLWMHFKDAIVAEVADWLADHGSLDDAIFYLDRGNLVQTASAAKQFHPAMIVMTRAHKRADLGKARDRFGQLPDLVHIDTLDAREVSWFRRQGVKVGIKVLSLESRPSRDRQRRRTEALAAGAQLILVDEPRFFGTAGRP